MLPFFRKHALSLTSPPVIYTFSLFTPPVSTFSKDISLSLIKSYYFMWTKPFQKDDTIRIGGYEGRVVGLDLNYLKIVKKDRNLVFIPVNTVLNSIIEVLK